MILSIITLNYKKKDLTIACMDSLYKQFGKEFAENTMELIIVDNNSGDDSVSVLTNTIQQRQYKNVQLIANPENKGFGAGNNKGAAQAIGEYFLFLNNDTVVNDRTILDMATHMQAHWGIGIMGGQMKNFNGTPQPSAGTFYTLWPAFLLLIGGHKLGLLDKSPKQIKKVDWVKGGMLMIRKEVFKRLSGFDENIFMYIEDMELCYRASAAGYAVYFFPKASVLHKEFGSSNKTFAIVNIYKNLLYFYKKHRSTSEYVIVKGMLKAKAKLAIILGKLFKKPELVETYKQALAGLKN